MGFSTVTKFHKTALEYCDPNGFDCEIGRDAASSDKCDKIQQKEVYIPDVKRWDHPHLWRLEKPLLLTKGELQKEKKNKLK